MNADGDPADAGEVFPHEFTATALHRPTGRSATWTVRYRFVPIRAPEGWITYPGQQCHDGRDGLLIQDDETRWWEQDLWGARCESFCLDIGCYGGAEKYVCQTHRPDWRGERIERVEFERPEDAATWAEQWMARGLCTR